MQSPHIPSTFLTHHHTQLSSVGSIVDLPYISNFLIKPASHLTTFTQCPATISQLQSSSPQLNILISTLTIQNKNTIQVHFHNPTTHQMTFYRQYNNQNDRITTLYWDPHPLRPNIFYALTNNGNSLLFDLFAIQFGPQTKIKGTNKASFNAIAIYDNILVLGRGHQIIFYQIITNQLPPNHNNNNNNTHSTHNSIQFVQIHIDTKMHCNTDSITCIQFHPQHHNFLFTADSSGKINIFQLQFQINEKTNEIKLKGQLDDYSLDLYQFTLTSDHPIDSFQFYGPDINNYDYIIVTSYTMSISTIFQYNCIDTTSELKVIKCNIKDQLNQFIVNEWKLDPQLFQEEHTDQIAELNAFIGYTMENNNNNDNDNHNDHDDITSELSNHNINNNQNINLSKSNDVNNIPHFSTNTVPNLTVTTSLTLTTKSTSTHTKDVQIDNSNDITPPEDENILSILDHPEHPRNWRVTDVISCSFCPDFTNTELVQFYTQHTKSIEQLIQTIKDVTILQDSIEKLFIQCFTTLQTNFKSTVQHILQSSHNNNIQQQLIDLFYQHLSKSLFIIATTSGGGIILAHIIESSNSTVIMKKIIPLSKPLGAHSFPIADSMLLIGPSIASLKLPILFTGGRDGKLSLFIPPSEHQRVQITYPAIFASIQQDLIQLQTGPQKVKPTRRRSGKKVTSVKTIDETTNK